MFKYLLIALPILMAITIHEYAHGYVAYLLGDPTARNSGRLSLNPLKHLDPLGTLMLFIVHFGWARPVPVDPSYFKNPRKGMLWVGLAGPGANILAAFVLGTIFRLFVILKLDISEAVLLVLGYGILINLALAFFNFLPIPPLDGSRILTGLLPRNLAYKYNQMERYGIFILLGLIILGQMANLPIIWFLIGPLIVLFGYLLTGVNLILLISYLERSF